MRGHYANHSISLLHKLFTGESRSNDVPLANLRAARRETITTPQDPNDEKYERHLYVMMWFPQRQSVDGSLGNYWLQSTPTTPLLMMSMTSCTSDAHRRQISSELTHHTIKRFGFFLRRTQSGSFASLLLSLRMATEYLARSTPWSGTLFFS